MESESPKVAQREKRMYPVLKSYLKNNGWNLVLTANGEGKGPFKIWVYGVKCEVDVVAFRWRSNNRIESIAIECKDGEDWKAAAYALPQATKYQVVFPNVFVATNAHELRHMDAVLDKLNLGYFEISGEVKLRKKASKGVVFQEKEFKRQVKNWALLLLAFEEAMRDFYLGQGYDKKDRQVDIFVKNNPGGVLQYVAWGYESRCCFGIFAESKPTVRQIAERVEVGEFLKLLNALPRGYELGIVQKKYPKIIYEKKFGIGHKKRVTELTLKELKRYIDDLKKWTKIQKNKTTMGGQIEIIKEIWDGWVELSRKQAVNKIKRAQKELSDLYRYLNEL